MLGPSRLRRDAVTAAVNLFDATVRGGLADLRRMPSALIDEGPQRRVHRYLPVDGGTRPDGAPGAARPAARGARAVLRPAPRLLGRRAPAPPRPRHLPRRLRPRPLQRPLARARALDRGRDPAARCAPSPTMRAAGRCSSSAGASAASSRCSPRPRTPTLPSRRPRSSRARSTSRACRSSRRCAPIAAVTQGQLVTQLYRVLGGAPAPLVKRGYQLAGIDKYVMKPWTIADATCTTASCSRRSRRSTCSWTTCTRIPAARSASSTTASSAPTTWPTGGSR